MMKAMTTPMNIFSKQSHWIPIPNVAATPPKPTMADAEIKVAPYERAMMMGFTFRPPSK